MFRKIFTYQTFLVTFLFIIILMLFGALLRHHYLGGERAKSLQKIAVFFAEIPKNTKDMLENRDFNLNKQKKLKKHKDKNRFEQFIENKRNALLVLPRYDHSLGRSIVDIVDLNNFKTIHTYKHDIMQMNSLVKNIQEFPTFSIDNSPVRFTYQNPLILEDGSLMGIYIPAYKIDFCSNLQWVNDEELFNHSQMLDHEGNIWARGIMKPESKYIKKYSIKDFIDDSIIKINTDGEILYNKSVTEILIENSILSNNFPLNYALNSPNEIDPIHLNDIEPAFNDTEHWKKGDIFLSARHLSAIIHFRPDTNKVINYITGPFAQQHDVDIISENEISIFNNNNFFVNNQYSEIIIYNFDTKKFRKLFNNQLQKEKFKTVTEGLSHIFNDGSLMVEEQDHGRIILFNNQGKKEWEFVNKDQNGNIGFISWSRVIEDEKFVEKFKSLVKSKKCSN